jgi:hypothetical protein
MCRNEKLLAITYPNVSKSVVTEGGWISCDSAVIMPKKSDTDLLVYDDVCSLLIKCAQRYVRCQDRLRDILEDSSLACQVATPAFVRTMLRSENVNATKQLSQSVLSYVMTDLIMLVQGEGLEELENLPILPLHDSSVCGVLRTYSVSQAAAVTSIVVWDLGWR